MDTIMNIIRWEKWKLGRMDYILSLAIMVLGLCLSIYLHDYCNAHYNPVCVREDMTGDSPSSYFTTPVFIKNE